jgi:hypothetical protein
LFGFLHGGQPSGSMGSGTTFLRNGLWAN